MSIFWKICSLPLELSFRLDRYLLTIAVQRPWNLHLFKISQALAGNTSCGNFYQSTKKKCLLVQVNWHNSLPLFHPVYMCVFLFPLKFSGHLGYTVCNSQSALRVYNINIYTSPKIWLFHCIILITHVPCSGFNLCNHYAS